MAQTTYTADMIRMKLATDERWVRRALVRLYERQTLAEQGSESTHNHNQRGFQPCDARWFSKLAKTVMANPHKVLSFKQLAILRRPWRGAPAICKYANQIMDIMAEDAAAKANVAPAPVQVAAKPVTAPAKTQNNCHICGTELPHCDCYWSHLQAQADRNDALAAWCAKYKEM